MTHRQWGGIMRSLRETLGENIRNIRMEKGISQEDLAFMCGLHRTYISDIERATRNVAVDNIEKIAIALSVKASALLDERNM